jgi:hypothetical protein
MSHNEAYQQALQTVLQQIQNLPPDDQDRLMEEVFVKIKSQRQLTPAQKLRLKQRMEAAQRGETLHSITEWRGIGKNDWRGIDVKKYIAEERASWDG